MWVWIVSFAALAPLLWWVPERARLATVTVASLVGIGSYDPTLAIGILVAVSGVDAVLRWLPGRSSAVARAVCILLLLILAAVFVWNKLAAAGGGALPSQGGLTLMGYSYLALKLAAVILDTLRGAPPAVSRGTFLAWALFLPTYPSGPIEELRHFQDQRPRLDWARVVGGLDRILFGLVKLLLFSHYLAEWTEPILRDPAAHSELVLLAAVHGFTLRFYLDFSGYSDVAIGVAALLGIEIQENFDWPLVQRNLARLWQRWHMTLTAWLRRYLFVPLSRSLMRCAPRRAEVVAVAVAQLATMVFCGLWHGISWGFLVWGLLQGLGLVWLGVAARPLGARLPDAVRRWWRASPSAHVLSVLITFHYFSFCNVFAVLGLEGAVLLLLELLA